MHPVTTLIVPIAAWIWLGLPLTAEAQERKGYSVAVGVGAGSLGSSHREGSGSRQAVAVTHISIGATVNQQWGVGVDLGGFDVDVADLPGPVTCDFISGTLAYYPGSASGFHIKGGVDALISDLHIVDEFGTKATAHVGTGFGFMAGTGWDVHIGRRFWLTPALSFRHGRPGDLVVAGRTRVADWKYNMAGATVGIKFD